MTDAFTPEERSRIMSRIRSRGNAATELRFIQILRTYGIKGWRRGTKLPGRPDFVFQRARVTVFVDGDFWHGNPRKFRLPKSNLSYWENKILSNIARDKRINRALRQNGWVVVRFWQTGLKNEKLVANRLLRFLNGTSRSSRYSLKSLGTNEIEGKLAAEAPAIYLRQRTVTREKRKAQYRRKPL